MRVRGLAVREALLAAMLFIAAAHAGAQAQGIPPSPIPAHATVVLFADNPSRIDSWDAIFAALRRNLPEAVSAAPSIDTNPEIMRGDAVLPGLSVDSSVIVFLHGDCSLYPRPAQIPRGKTLGWVLEQKREIQSFIHVDCTRIAQALSAQSEPMNSEQRTAAMSEALARVILHEWIHIASQRSGHHQNGLGKAQFTIEDLIPSTTARTIARNSMPRVP